ncbi:hexose transporter [Penicillium canescens]|nr:hexose transporter [Penicillium canescens]KAJ6028884.1 hexose transporter [Penicillium canescens]
MKFKLCTAYVFVAAFAAATDGYQTGLNAGILVNPGFVKQFATEKTSKGKDALAADIMAGWGTILPVGQFIANVSLPFLSARCGRRAAFASSWALLPASREHLLVAKMLAGIGLGCLQCTLPMHIAEVARTRIRGIVLMTYNLW